MFHEPENAEMLMMTRKRGFTLIELLVVIAIIALLIGLLLPALAKAQKNARSLKDKTQIKQIHQSMLVYAEENDGRLPVPGLINRQLDPYTGQQLPGRGPEDHQQNDTPELYSAMIARNLLNPKILVGPTEQNPVVEVDRDYDFNTFDPTSDSYWDPEFEADIESGPSNTSYFHMALCGKRKELKWRDTASNGDPMVGTRGPENGATTGEEYTRSQTLLLHGPEELWIGNVCFADNHVESLDNFFPSVTSYWPADQVAAAKDNIFDAEFEDYGANPMASNDAFLVISIDGAQEDQVEPIYDELIN